MLPRTRIFPGDFYSPDEFLYGISIGVAVTTVGVGTFYCLKKCIRWYSEPRCRPACLRSSRPENEEMDIESLTWRVAKSEDDRRWMAALQYYLNHELDPSLPIYSSETTSRQTSPPGSQDSAVGGSPRPPRNVDEQIYRFVNAMFDTVERYRFTEEGTVANIDENRVKWIASVHDLCMKKRQTMMGRVDRMYGSVPQLDQSPRRIPSKKQLPPRAASTQN